MAAARDSGVAPARPAAKPTRNVVTGAAGRTTPCAASPARSRTASTSRSTSASPNCAARAWANSIRSGIHLLQFRVIFPRVDVEQRPLTHRDLTELQLGEQLMRCHIDQRGPTRDGTLQGSPGRGEEQVLATAGGI